jgi:hypothetical protein
MTLVLTPGQRHEAVVLTQLMETGAVKRCGPGVVSQFEFFAQMHQGVQKQTETLPARAVPSADPIGS